MEVHVSCAGKGEGGAHSSTRDIALPSTVLLGARNECSDQQKPIGTTRFGVARTELIGSP